MSGDLRLHRVTWYSSNRQTKQSLLYLLVKKCPEHGERDVKEKHLQHHLCLSNQSFLQQTRMAQEELLMKRRATIAQTAIHSTATGQDTSCNIYTPPELCMLWVPLLISVKKHKVCLWVCEGPLVKGDTHIRDPRLLACILTAAQHLALCAALFF